MVKQGKKKNKEEMEEGLPPVGRSSPLDDI